MKAAEDNGTRVWVATKWVGGALALSVTVVFGLDLAGDREATAFRFLVGGLFALAAGGLVWALNIAVAKSQQSRAAGIAKSKWRTGRGIVITSFLLVLQVLALLGLVASQALALNNALQPSDSADSPNELLLRELKEYEGALSETNEVQVVCRQHIEDDRATNAFVSICQVFLDGRSPELDEVEQMIDRLSQ